MSIKYLRSVMLAMLALSLVACGGGGGSNDGNTGGAGGGSTGGSTGGASAPIAKITAPSTVTSGQAGYAASVTGETGATYAWSITNGTIMVGSLSDSIAFVPGSSGVVGLSVKVTGSSGASSTSTAEATITSAPPVEYNTEQAVSDGAQSTTIAFSGFGMITGNLGAQSFFPPGKVADYWGFQYLRDNDADRMGHNTSFLTRVACNVLFVLNESQLEMLKSLAKSQVSDINLYAWKRYPLMKAFRRLMDGDVPAGTSELSLDAIKAASREIYLIDGQLSYERAVVYANIYRSLTAEQKTYLGTMVGKGYQSWPAKAEEDVRAKTQGLTHDEVVAVMTYAGDLYSWYAGSVATDVYFCPERHGTYYGSFYIKDAPAVGHPGYGIDETMTGTVGRALVDSSLGYISPEGATLMRDLATNQTQNLYGNATHNIVLARTRIAEALRSLITSAVPTTATLAEVKATVDAYSVVYGDLDGENNYQYATTFARIYRNLDGTYLTDAQKTALASLRKKYMTVTYSDGTTVDYSGGSSYFLYAAEVPDSSADLVSYLSDSVTSPLFK